MKKESLHLDKATATLDRIGRIECNHLYWEDDNEEEAA